MKISEAQKCSLQFNITFISCCMRGVMTVKHKLTNTLLFGDVLMAVYLAVHVQRRELFARYEIITV